MNKTATRRAAAPRRNSHTPTAAALSPKVDAALQEFCEPFGISTRWFVEDAVKIALDSVRTEEETRLATLDAWRKHVETKNGSAGQAAFLRVVEKELRKGEPTKAVPTCATAVEAPRPGFEIVAEFTAPGVATNVDGALFIGIGVRRGQLLLSTNEDENLIGLTEAVAWFRRCWAQTPEDACMVTTPNGLDRFLAMIEEEFWKGGGK